MTDKVNSLPWEGESNDDAIFKERLAYSLYCAREVPKYLRRASRLLTHTVNVLEDARFLKLDADELGASRERLAKLTAGGGDVAGLRHLLGVIDTALQSLAPNQDAATVSSSKKSSRPSDRMWWLYDNN